MNNLFIISLGGSLLYPDEIDTGFLKAFKKLLISEVKKGSRFVIIVGGGKTCRVYQKALADIAKPSVDNLDWMGIYTTRTNAQLFRFMLGKLAHPQIVEDPNKKVNFKEKILVGGGWVPGRSTDFVAARLAEVYEAKTIINLSNIDFLYTKDPRKHKDAKKITKISWKDMRKLLGKRVPGGNYPFDPVASKLAEKNKLKVIIANGKNLKNLQSIFSNKPYVGTTIS